MTPLLSVDAPHARSIWVADTTVAVKLGGVVGGVSSGGGTAIDGLLAYAARSAVYDMRCQILVLATVLSLPRAKRGRCAQAQSFRFSLGR